MLVFQQKRSMILFARKNRNRSIYIVRGSNIYFSFHYPRLTFTKKKTSFIMTVPNTPFSESGQILYLIKSVKCKKVYNEKTIQ